jgi:hypothetical protein
MKGALCFFFHLTFVYENDMELKVGMLFWHHKTTSKVYVICNVYIVHIINLDGIDHNIKIKVVVSKFTS